MMILVSDRELCQALHAHDNKLYVSSVTLIEPLTTELVMLFNLAQKDKLSACIQELMTHYARKKNELKRIVLILIGHQVPDLDRIGQSLVHGLLCQGFTNTNVKIYLTQQSVHELHDFLQRQDFSVLSPLCLEQELPLSNLLNIILEPDVLVKIEAHWGKIPLFKTMAFNLKQQFQDIATLEQSLGLSNPSLPLELKLNTTCDSTEYQMLLHSCDGYIKTIKVRLSAFAKSYLEQFSHHTDNYHLSKLELMQALYDVLQRVDRQSLMVFLDKLMH